MKLKLPKFVRNMISKRVSKMLYEDLGFDTYIQINDLTLDTKGRKYTIHVDTQVEVDKRGLKTYIKSSLKD